MRKLFPLGVYWDKQFANPQSDLSLWIDAKAQELHRLKSRWPEMIAESTPQTTVRYIDDWERVLLNNVYPHLPLNMRRSLLLAKRQGRINRVILQDLAALYTATIKDVRLPYHSAFFGHTCIGINRMCSPASFSVVFIDAEIGDPALQADFEAAVITALLANHIVYFFYS